VAGYGIIYEIVISHGYLRAMHQTVSEAVERTVLHTISSRHGNIEADIYVSASPPCQAILDAYHEALVSLAISKRYTARLEDQIQIVFCSNELQAPLLMHSELTPCRRNTKL
jgi:hypothetical protein